MKLIGKLRLSLAVRVCVAALVVWMAASVVPSNAAPPGVKGLPQGKWPAEPGGISKGVAVSGHYAYVADYFAGLQVIDMSNSTNYVQVGGYVTDGYGEDVAVFGNYAYVADERAGLQVIDVSNPTNCVRVSGYDTRGWAYGVTVAASGVYVAAGEAGLLVLPTIPNVQFTLRVEAETNQPFTLEAATDLSGAGNWSPLVTTNVPAMPFDFVDFDVRIAEKPQKFYRVRQP